MPRSTALCLFDHVRDPTLTAPALRRHVAHALDADVFIHLSGAARESPSTRLLTDVLRPMDVVADARDWTRDDFAADLQPHTDGCACMWRHRIFEDHIRVF